jgi:hypothetical protein
MAEDQLRPTEQGPPASAAAQQESRERTSVPIRCLQPQGKGSPAPVRAVSASSSKAKKVKPKAVVYGGKRKRVEGTPDEETIEGFSDDEPETRKVEAKKTRIVVPPKRGKVCRWPAVLTLGQEGGRA